MLQLFFAVAFSAVPLTLYLPPIRSFSLFVDTVSDLFRNTTIYVLGVYSRFRFAFTRVFGSVVRFPDPM